MGGPFKKNPIRMAACKRYNIKMDKDVDTNQNKAERDMIRQ